MIFKRILLPCLLLVLLVNSSFSQHNHKKLTAAELNSGKYQYAPQTVIFKIKPQFAKDFHSHISFKKVLDSVKVISIEKLLPGAESPNGKKNRHGRPMTDVSSIYVLKYSSSQTVAEVMSKLEKTGITEYAEPMFSYSVQYVPNDPGVQKNAPTDSTEYFYLNRMQAFQAW